MAFPTLSTTSVAVHQGLSLNHAISSALTLVGWHDKRSLIAQAENGERALADSLQTAYARYLALPDRAAIDSLNASLTAVIVKLGKDQETALRFAQDTEYRLSQKTTAYFDNGVTAFVRGLTKSLFGSEDARVEHYKQLAAKYAAQVKELSHLQATLLQLAVETEVLKTVPYSNHQRRLLQTNFTLPTTQQIYCFPSDVCDLSNSDGISGFVLQGEAGGDASGWSVSNAGDINGDGLSDVVIGAHAADAENKADSGKSYVVFGSKNSSAWGNGVFNLSGLMNGQRGFVLQGEAVGDICGWSVSNAGDMNGDGVSDLVIGAYAASPLGRLNAGKGYVVFGSNLTNAWGGGVLNISGLMNGQRGFVLQGELQGDWSGYSVSSAGDVNGDGLSDLVIGAVLADPSGRTDAGKTYVVFGSRNSSAWGNGIVDLSTLMNGQRGFVLQGEAISDWSGFSVSHGGDLNGDGLSDLVIGAIAGGPGRTDAGKTYVVFGSNSSAWGNGVLNLSTLMNGQRGFVLQGDAISDWFGYCVSSAGDVNGDGLSDLLIGSPHAAPVGKSQAGKSYVVFGSRNSSAWGNGIVDLSTLMNGQRGFVLQGEAAGDQTGTSVKSVGDMNGDGLSDVLIGGYGAGPLDKIDAGKTYVIFGSNSTSAWGSGILNISTLMNGQRGFALQGESANDVSGYSISSVSDMNGDSLPDLLIGAFGAFSEGRPVAGKSYVVFGKGLPSLFFARNNLRLNATQTLLLSLSEINVASNRTAPNLNLTYFTVSNITHGVFTSLSAPTINISAFYLQNISDGQIQFVHDGSASAPEYRLFASHPKISQLTVVYSDAEVEFNANPPFLVNNQLSIEQRMPVTLNINDLSATDPDDAEGNLSFTISGLIYGQFNQYASDGALVAPNITKFTQQAVMDGRIQLIPDGSRFAPYYLVSVSDPRSTTRPKAVNITGFLYEPEFHFQTMVFDQGRTGQLPFSAINATDVETRASDLAIEVANVTGGYLVDTSSSNVSTPVLTFNQSALMNGAIGFAVNSNALNISFLVRACDGRLKSPWQTPLISLNHAPIRQTNINDQTITKGRLFDITFSSMAFLDPDNDNLTYHAKLSTGELLPQEIHFSYPPIRFEGQLVGAESITIQIVAADPRGLNASSSFVLKNFNAKPLLTLKTIMIDQDQATTLRYQDINATDLETFVEDIIIETDEVTEGKFIYSSTSDLTITAFRQFALIIGTLQFVHNGGNRTPTFAFRAFDGFLFTDWQNATVTLNQKPFQQYPLDDQTVTQGTPFSFTLPSELFKDPDGNPLNYTAKLPGSVSLPKEIQFTPPNRFQGNLPTVSSFPIEVQATDPRQLKAAATFTLSSRSPAATFDYKALYTSFSSLGGIAVTFLAYLYLRRRIAKHRRDFAFANDLRKVLNLEYYDFSRFDGDSYKTRVNNFLQGLQLEHQEFYTQLTPEEQNSFAVCVAEILTKRGLVSRSGCGGCVFGVFCFLNVGRPSELNLKSFEVQSRYIATEAVTSWKNCVAAEKEPLKRWPYYSPSKKEKLKVFCCCAKPSSADRWLVSDSAQGIALTELKKHESSNSALTIEPLAERKTVSDFESRMLSVEERVRTITERVDAVESRPLLQQGRCIEN